MKAPSLTLGIEEEYQIIDPKTRELRSYITEILEGDSLLMGEIKPELHQSMVEIGTKVCRSPAETMRRGTRRRSSSSTTARTPADCLCRNVGVHVTWPTAKRSSSATTPLK